MSTNLFEEGDPFDDPRWKAARVKTATQTPDLVGCPIKWLEKVLPHIQGASQLAVALLLYRRWVICGRRAVFNFPNSDLNRLGIHRTVKYRALTRLQEAGLITVDKAHGQAVKVMPRWK